MVEIQKIMESMICTWLVIDSASRLINVLGNASYWWRTVALSCVLSSKVQAETFSSTANKWSDWPPDVGRLNYIQRQEQHLFFHGSEQCFQPRCLESRVQSITQKGWPHNASRFFLFLLSFLSLEHFLLNVVARHTRLQSLNVHASLFSPERRFLCNRRLLRKS